MLKQTYVDNLSSEFGSLFDNIIKVILYTAIKKTFIIKILF